MITSPRFDKTLKILNWAGAIMIMLALAVIFFYAPTERTMGNVQRIFYFHVPLAWVGFLAFFITFVSSILYLWKRAVKWDTIAHASAEVGVQFFSHYSTLSAKQQKGFFHR